MSAVRRSSRITIPELAGRKGAAPIAVLTAYTAPIARLLDPHVDILLVGDSLGMVIYGLPTTLPVSLEMMIAHGRAVANASSRAAVVIDMPFGSYQASPAAAFESCARVMAETGCSAVKLEGGAEMAETISFLIARGIPVMGHVGMKPQSVNVLGGYRPRGERAEEAEAILRDAKAVADAGAFSVVIENTVDLVARRVTESISVPTIGIGASPGCDGQVLVIDDMLGLTESPPRFVKRYADMAAVVSAAVSSYAADVKARRFPGSDNVHGLPKTGS